MLYGTHSVHVTLDASLIYNMYFVFHLRAAIDTTETGDFSSATLLAPYIYTHQFARFGEDGMKHLTLGRGGWSCILSHLVISEKELNSFTSLNILKDQL